MANRGMRSQISRMPSALWQFLRDPIETVKRPTDLTWPELITVQTVGGVLSALCFATLERSTLDLMIGAVIFPLVTVMAGAVFTLLAYFYFASTNSTYLDIRRLHALVTYATVPYFILHAFAGLLPLFDLIGFALAAMLLIVGMVEQFSLDRRLVLRLIGLICVVFFMVWAAVHIAITN